MSIPAEFAKLITEANFVLATHRVNFGAATLNASDFRAWRSRCLLRLESLPNRPNIYHNQFKSDVRRPDRSSVHAGIAVLEEAQRSGGTEPDSTAAILRSPFGILQNICERFHKVVVELKNRRTGREPLTVDDEYDVQYLFRAILAVNFEDVRSEEGSPSHAASAPRLDFLLKKEKIALEVKMTRQGLKARELANQIIEDIARYRAHPDCETVVFFVYDPDHLITNPRGLEKDLHVDDGHKRIIVLIRPF